MFLSLEYLLSTYIPLDNIAPSKRIQWYKHINIHIHNIYIYYSQSIYRVTNMVIWFASEFTVRSNYPPGYYNATNYPTQTLHGWKNSSDGTCSFPRRLHGSPMEGSLESNWNITALSYWGVQGGQYLGTYFAEKNQSLGQLYVWSVLFLQQLETLVTYRQMS